MFCNSESKEKFRIALLPTVLKYENMFLTKIRCEMEEGAKLLSRTCHNTRVNLQLKYLTFLKYSNYFINPILTRALEGGILCPHLFFANNLKTVVRSAAKFGIPAHNSLTNLVCKFWLSRSKGQVTRSGQSQMCTSDRLQTSTSHCGHSYSPNDLKLWGWDIGVDANRMDISDFSFSWPRVRSIFGPAHYNPMKKLLFCQ